MNVLVVGAGVVGAATAITFCDLSWRVWLAERDPRQRAHIATGTAFPDEPELDAVLQRALDGGTLSLVDGIPTEPRPWDLVVLAVGTPGKPDEADPLDLGQVEDALRQLRGVLLASTETKWREGAPLLVLRSTLPVGAYERLGLHRWWNELGVASAYVPEFLRMGSALADARRPQRVVVGTPDGAVPAVLQPWLRHLAAPVHAMGWEEAVLAKLAANTFLALKVSFANELAELAANLGVDPHRVVAALSQDPRIGPYLRPGVGFGGPCLPKDARAYAAALRRAGLHNATALAAIQTNDALADRLADRLTAACGGLDGRQVLVLGVAFKSGSSQLTASPVLPLLAALRARGARVAVYDRRVGPPLRNVDRVGRALLASEVCVIAQADAAYVRLPWDRWARAGNRILFDTVGLLDEERLAALAGAGVRILGRATRGIGSLTPSRGAPIMATATK